MKTYIILFFVLANALIVATFTACLDSSSSSDSKPANIEGVWYDHNNGRYVFAQSGNQLTGSYKALGVTVPLTGVVDGKSVAFFIRAPHGTMTYDGTVKGNKIECIVLLTFDHRAQDSRAKVTLFR